jgi:SAM-dependent methyltransferase
LQQRPVHRSRLDAVEANRLFYRGLAAGYDESEPCVVQASERARLLAALRGAVEIVGPDARVLDACGGTGHASGMLVQLGARPVTVDISSDMLAVWAEKARALGYEPETIEAEILDFLQTNEATWDLIVFSSALHHLEDYLAVVKAAVGRLRPNGVLVTIFDPTRVGTVGRLIRRLDYVAYVCLNYPGDALRKALAKLRRTRSAENIGSIAERHAGRGVDDHAIHLTLEQEGMQVLVHERFYDARVSLIRWLLRLLRIPSSFSLTAQKRAA